MMDASRYRIFFWQKLGALFALPVFGLLLAISPMGRSWSATVWAVLAIAAGALVALYLFNAWRRAEVLLDDDGLTIFGARGREAWPLEKLLKVRQVGSYRVRMCFDPDIPGQHMHITFDVFDSDGFVDDLLDRYEEKTGAPLPEADDDAHDTAQPLAA